MAGLSRQKGEIPLSAGMKALGGGGRTAQMPMGEDNSLARTQAHDNTAGAIKRMGDAAENAVELVGKVYEKYKERADKIKMDVAINQAELDFDNKLTEHEIAMTKETGEAAIGAPDRYAEKLSKARDEAMAKFAPPDTPEADMYRERLNQKLTMAVNRFKVKAAQHEYAELKTTFNNQIKEFSQAAIDDAAKDPNGDPFQTVAYGKLVETLQKSFSNGYTSGDAINEHLKQVDEKIYHTQFKTFISEKAEISKAGTETDFEKYKSEIDKRWEGKLGSDILADGKKKLEAFHSDAKRRAELEAKQALAEEGAEINAETQTLWRKSRDFLAMANSPGAFTSPQEKSAARVQLIDMMTQVDVLAERNRKWLERKGRKTDVGSKATGYEFLKRDLAETSLYIDYGEDVVNLWDKPRLNKERKDAELRYAAQMAQGGK